MQELLIILLLVLLNGVFSGAEIAILSLRKTRIAELVEAGSGNARAVARLREHPESFLATVQIGITVIGATAAAFGGSSVAEDITPVLLGLGLSEGLSESLAVTLVVAGVSFLSLVLGELVPKSLALRAGESYALLVARPLAAIAWAGRPVVAVLTGASNLVLRVFGDRTTFTEARLSREEVQQLVEEAATSGSVDPHAGDIASRALGFSNLDAYTLMVPRSGMVTLPHDADLPTIAALARASGHARVPVYDRAHDNYLGFVNVRDLLAEAATNPSWSLAALTHPLLYVPELMKAPALLRKLQEGRAHLALVTDEQGTVMGLVTIEDVLEEIVGEIMSENDRPAAAYTREDDGSWVVPGAAPVHELTRDLGIELPEGEYATVAGLCVHLAGSIPARGWSGQGGEALLEVLDASPRRVKSVRIRRA